MAFDRRARLWLAARFRRGSFLHRHGKRRNAIISRARRQLRADLQSWLEVGQKRAALAQAAADRGEDWETQARNQGFEIDTSGVELHNQCAECIATHSLRRGRAPWKRSSKPVPACSSWEEYEHVCEMPGDAAFRAVISDSLSFPLTAAYAARIAGVSAEDTAGCLSLLVLGAEAGTHAGA